MKLLETKHRNLNDINTKYKENIQETEKKNIVLNEDYEKVNLLYKSL